MSGVIPTPPAIMTIESDSRPVNVNRPAGAVMSITSPSRMLVISSSVPLASRLICCKRAAVPDGESFFCA